jgi:hypothetical protein
MAKTEKYIAPLVVLLGWYFLYKISFGPLTKDEIQYMNLSLFPVEYRPFVFRYFHIYLQKLFFFLAGDVFVGARILGSFCVAATAYLIYLVTRRLLPNSSLYIPLLAIALFLSSSIVLPYLGVTWVDTTLMLLTMLVIFLYITLVQSPDMRRYGLIFILGLTLYCALRTKEMGILLGIFIFGIPTRRRVESTKSYGWLGALVFGALAGHLTMMVLDGIFLNNFWFSILPSNVMDTAGVAINMVQTTVASMSPTEVASMSPTVYFNNWLSFIAQKDVIIIFILYLLGYTRLSNQDSKNRFLLLAMFPLIVIAFLILTSAIRRWIFSTRYLLSIIPVLCIFSAVYLNSFSIKFNLSKSFRKNAIWFFVGVFLLIIFVIFTLLSGYNISAYVHRVNVRALAVGIVYPFCAVTIIVAGMFTEKRRTAVGLIITTIVLVVGILAPLIRTAGIHAARVKYSQNRFYPLAAFENEIGFRETRSVFISTRLYEEYEMLGSGAKQCKWMMELFFKEKTFDKRFFVSDNLRKIVNYDRALISRSDFKLITENTELNKVIVDDAKIFEEPSGKVVLVKRE